MTTKCCSTKHKLLIQQNNTSKRTGKVRKHGEIERGYRVEKVELLRSVLESHRDMLFFPDSFYVLFRQILVHIHDTHPLLSQVKVKVQVFEISQIVGQQVICHYIKICMFALITVII